MPQFTGYIFDIDGTLTSTNELIFATFNHVAEKYLGKKWSKSDIISLFGPTEDVILKEWMKTDYIKARKDYYDYYRKNHPEMVDIYPGIREILEKIKEKNLPLAIFTGKGRDTSEITLELLGLRDYFDLVITGDDVTEHKPSAEGILKVIDKFGLEPGKVLMIGDSPTDVKASRDAGVKIASVLWDAYAKEEVEQMDTDYKFYTVDELKDFITKALEKS